MASEVLNLSDEESQCSDLPRFQREIYAGTGAYLHGSTAGPIVCGGYDKTNWPYEVSNKCYNLLDSTPVATMLLKRIFASSVPLDNGTTLWITGGQERLYDMLHKSTEFVAFGSSHAGPDLPMTLFAHCIAMLNSSAAMVIGGYQGSRKQSSTWLANFDSQTWTAGPHLNEARAHHFCGPLTDSQDGSQMVIVAGGYNNHYDTIKTTEIWILHSFSWTQGPDLPQETAAGGSVTSSDGKTFYVISGYNKLRSKYIADIFSIQCFAKVCQCRTLKQKLSYPRSDAVATLIPYSMANCTKTKSLSSS